ncbi:DUF4127 family protein [Salisediminibacterium beveridgei]|uniref:DUF4127 family protein n=1 Tax=Salisediminibacterium beveridgei TaxID=632773 RepID=A0A1D7QRW2_9BACI|nr:DUF4127 family protein [Salisediminibacterium beveridgei]AOM81756.1 hypothetical protein BBEV_0362 [Salisediminibacterium beveridgei]
MKKIAVLPLDNRPCCYDFTEIFGDFGVVEVIQPPKDILGEFTYFGDVEKIKSWLMEVAGEVDGMVLAIDQLAYGGLVPSRMMKRSLETCHQHVDVIKDIKKAYPTLTIYAVNVLMRISISTKNRQFTEYWKHVFDYSQLYDRLHRLNEDVEEELARVKANLPKEVLAEYLQARERNHAMNQKMIQWAAEGIIDFLAITQEDASAIGMHLQEQHELMKEIYYQKVQRKVLVYPGADEATQTLLAKMAQDFMGKRLKIYPKYTSQQGKLLVAKFEDRPIEETVVSHLTAAGAIVTEDIQEADIVLYVNTPIQGNLDGNLDHQMKGHFNSRHQLLYFIESLDRDLTDGKTVAVADISFPNASDVELMQFLLEEDLYFQLSAYAGWNTAGNSLGTCIGHCLIHQLAKETIVDRDTVSRTHLAFMFNRAMDEWAFQAHVRGSVNTLMEKKLGIHSTNLEDHYDEVNETVIKEMKPFFEELKMSLKNSSVKAPAEDWRMSKCQLPWNRTFEVQVKTEAVL